MFSSKSKSFQVWKMITSASITMLLASHALAAIEYKTLTTHENGKASIVKGYENNVMVEERHFDDQGIMVSYFTFSHPDAKHIIRTDYNLDQSGKIKNVLQKIQYKVKANAGDITANDLRDKEWVYDDDHKKVEYIATYNSSKSEKNDQIIKKEYLDADGKVKSYIVFNYNSNSPTATGFSEYEVETNKKIAEFNINEKHNTTKALQRKNLDELSIQLEVEDQKKSEKLLIAIIDSGFDYNHPELASKWWNNPNEPIDGKDNDGNGWVDDNFGWNQVTQNGLPGEVTEKLIENSRPLSHGTHVAHLAIRGLRNAALVGFAGDYTQPDFIERVSKYLKTNKIKLVNISIGLPMDIRDMFGMKETVNAYRMMIENNPETLFVVAAGNEEMNIDQIKNRQYPASFNLPNVLKVGATDTSSWTSKPFDKMKMAWFSNVGTRSVDVLAPGVDILAASLGGGLIEHTGTSMATPIMLNQIAQMWQKVPSLTASEIKQLLISTATKLSPAPLIASEGVANIEKATFEAKLSRLVKQKAQQNGPNCWNSALYLSDLNQGIYHTTGSEFRKLIDSNQCQEVPVEKINRGDILALRRYSSKGSLLPAAQFSEVHAFVSLGENKVITKNGISSNIGYEESTIQDTFNVYKSQEIKNCRQLQIPAEHCNLQLKAYRCRSGLLVSHDANLKLSVIDNHALRSIERIEHLRHEQMSPAILNAEANTLNTSADATKMKLAKEIKELGEFLDQNESKVSKWLVELIDLRLESLELYQ